MSFTWKTVLNFDVVKYLFLQRSAAIFALVDRQLNTKKSHSERFSRQPVPNARALDTDHNFR